MLGSGQASGASHVHHALKPHQVDIAVASMDAGEWLLDVGYSNGDGTFSYTTTELVDPKFANYVEVPWLAAAVMLSVC